MASFNVLTLALLFAVLHLELHGLPFVSVAPGYRPRESGRRPFTFKDDLTTSSSKRNILAVQYLLPGPTSADRSSFTALHCSLANVYSRVAPHTPVDVFIWAATSTIEVLPGWIESFPNLQLLPIDSQSWKLPTEFGNQSHWLFGDKTSTNEYLASRWRLTYAFDFARARGYQYILRMDPDTLTMQDFPINLVSTLQQSGQAIGHRNRYFLEDPAVAAGAPEMIQYWMASRRVSQPPGSLLGQLSTPDVKDISTASWQRHVFPINFLLVSVDFWFEPIVQDFLGSILDTGADLTQHWLERGAVNMVRLLFLQDAQVALIPVHSVLHQALRTETAYETIGCAVPPPDISVSDTSATEKDEKGTSAASKALREKPSDVRAVEFLAAWDSGAILVMNGLEHPDEWAHFHWRYNASSSGADTSALNDYDGIIKKLMARVINVDWWEEHDVRERLDRLLTKPILPVDLSALDGEEIVEILEQQLNDYVDYYCVDSVPLEGDRLVQYCDGVRRLALQRLHTQMEDAPTLSAPTLVAASQ